MIRQNKLRKGAIQLIVLVFVFMIFFISVKNSTQINSTQTPEELITQDEDEMYEKIGSWQDNYGEITDIFVRDNIAYITARYEYLLLIVNVTDKTSPTLISKIPYTSGVTTSIWVDGNYAVIGIQTIPHYSCLIDISNLTNPELLSYFYHIEQAEDVYIENQYVYIIDSYNGTHVYDISDDRMPELISIYDFGDDTRSLFIEGNYAYICDAVEGLHIVDISKKNKPKLVGFSAFGATDLYLVGNDLYLLLTIEQVYIFDITDKSQPTIQVFFGHGMNSKIIVKDNYAYVSDHLHGLKVYSVANFFAISEVGYYFDGGLSPSMIIEGNFLYFCEEMDGVIFLDISSPSNPTKIGEFDLGTGSEAYQLEKQDDLIFMSDHDDGLEIIDVSDPTKPEQILEFDDNNPVFDVALKDDVAIIANGDLGVLFLNLSDNLDIIYLINQPGFTFVVQVIDDLLFMDNGYYGTYIYNISDITAPVIVAQFNVEGYSVYDFHLENDLLYMACDSGLQVYNMTDQANPFPIGNYSNYYTTSLEIQNNLSYTTAYGYGIVVFNITDPTNITVYTEINYDAVSTNMFLENNIAYVTAESYDYCKGIFYVINISNILNPNLIGIYFASYAAYDVFIEDSIAYISNSYEGLTILNLSSMVPIPEYPCPYTPPITLTPSPPPDTVNGYYFIAIFVILPTIYLLKKKFLINNKRK